MCSSFEVTRLNGKADHLPPCGVSLRMVGSRPTWPHMPLCLAQRQIYILIGIGNLHIMMQYLDTLLFVNIHHGSKYCPSVLKRVAILVPAQRMRIFYFHYFLQKFFLFKCFRVATQCVILIIYFNLTYTI